MRLHDMPSSLLWLVAAILAQPARAGPFPFGLGDQMSSLEDMQNVEKRCSNPCGYYGQLCCDADQYCYTDAASEAQCGQASTTQAVQATNGVYSYYTSTYVQTDLQTVTTTMSTFFPSTTTSCKASLGETSCGSCCCLSGQYCQNAALGSCVAVGGDSSAYYSSFYTLTIVTTLSQGTAPVRPTTETIVTVTQTGSTTTTGSFTTTQAFETASPTVSGVISGAQVTSSGGLSGGAIAGIVIGVILGIILLLLICACCCFKGLLDGLLAIFGLGPRSRRRTEEITYEERHSHRDSRGGRTWFGTRPGKASRTEVVEKRSSGWGGLGGVAAALGGLALILGLKRRHDRQKSEKNGSSGYGSSYYSSEYTSSSSESSDRRTRDSRRSQRSRSRR